MTPLDRRVFQLYYWEGLSEQEIQHTVRFSNDVQNSRVDSSLARIKTLLMDNTLREQWKPVMLTYNDNINSGWPTQNDSDLSSVHDLLESSLVLLSVQERAVVRLRFWEDLSAREIADILHISPIRKVYALLEYALKKLRRSALRELRE
jgi:RNA polymerase sigma factor (sigma-70 family)